MENYGQYSFFINYFLKNVHTTGKILLMSIWTKLSKMGKLKIRSDPFFNSKISHTSNENIDKCKINLYLN